MGRRFRRAVVTGGAGFIGSHLCEQLVWTGTEVVCVDSLLTGDPGNVEHLLAEPNFRFHHADLVDGISVSRSVDAVFHLACPASPRDYLRFPIETLRSGAMGTERALELAQRHGARFLLASTSEVYGDPLENPQREDYWGNVNPVGPRSVYDEAKRYAEALTTAYRTARGADTAIARIFNTYGPRMRAEDGRMIPTFIRQALAGEPITITGDGLQTRSLCFVGDTVRGLLALAGSGRSGPVNIGNPHELTVSAVAERVRDVTRGRSPIRYLPARVDDPRRRCPDIGRARRELGWEPAVSLDEGLAATVSWFAGQQHAAESLRNVND